MIDRQRILVAAQRLQSFTAKVLALYANATKENVYKVLDRDKRFFEKIDTTRGVRGRPQAEFRVRPTMVESLAKEVSGFHTRLTKAAAALRNLTNGLEEVTDDLLVAESYIFDQFPNAQSVETQVEFLRLAFLHLRNDLQLAPLLADSSRRKVDEALLRLSVDEFGKSKSTSQNSILFRDRLALYHSAKTNRILLDIVPLLHQLPAGFREEVENRLNKSPVLSATDRRFFLPQVPNVGIAADRHNWSLIERPSLEVLLVDDLVTANSEMNKRLIVALEASGVSVTVTSSGEIHRQKNDPAMISILSCDSAVSIGRTRIESQVQPYLTCVTHVVDAGFRSELREVVLRSGRNYVPHGASADPELLIMAMEPLPEMIDDFKLVLEIVDEKEPELPPFSVPRVMNLRVEE